MDRPTARRSVLPRPERGRSYPIRSSPTQGDPGRSRRRHHRSRPLPQPDRIGRRRQERSVAVMGRPDGVTGVIGRIRPSPMEGRTGKRDRRSSGRGRRRDPMRCPSRAFRSPQCRSAGSRAAWDRALDSRGGATAGARTTTPVAWSTTPVIRARIRARGTIARRMTPPSDGVWLSVWVRSPASLPVRPERSAHGPRGREPLRRWWERWR